MKRLINVLVMIITFVSLSTAADDIVINITRAELTCSLQNDDEGNVVVGASKLELVFDKSTQSILDDLNPDRDCDGNPEERCKPYKKAKDWITNTLKDFSNYYVIRVADGTRADLTIALPGETTLYNTIAFPIVNPYDLTQAHMLIAKTINSAKAVPFMIKVEPNSSCELVRNKLPVPPDSEKKEVPKLNTISDFVTKPAAKDNPALKVDFSLVGSKRNTSVYNFNIKFRSEQRRRLGLGGYYDLTYFFLDTEVRINAKASDRKNVLNFGAFRISHNRVFHDDGNHNREIDTSDWRFPGLNTTITPKVETEWGFNELSYIADIRETLPINVYQSRGTILQLNPFVGFEGGYKHLTKDSKPGWRIARPLAGVGLTINLFRKDDKPRIAFQADYIRRFFLHPELSYGYNAAGKETPDQSTKRPRDQFKAKFTFNAGLFSPFIEYEYGRVPPKYILVNSSFKTGILFDVDIPWKNFF